MSLLNITKELELCRPYIINNLYQKITTHMHTNTKTHTHLPSFLYCFTQLLLHAGQIHFTYSLLLLGASPSMVLDALGSERLLTVLTYLVSFSLVSHLLIMVCVVSSSSTSCHHEMCSCAFWCQLFSTLRRQRLARMMSFHLRHGPQSVLEPRAGVHTSSYLGTL